MTKILCQRPMKNDFLIRDCRLESHYWPTWDVPTVMKPLSKPQTKVITVLIADDHPVVREGLVAIFKSQKDIKVVAEAYQWRGGLRALPEAFSRCSSARPADAKERWAASNH